MKIDSTKRAFIFQPWLALGCSLFGAALYAIYALRSPTSRAHTFDISGSFLYVVPIVVPFVAFLFDRAERFRELKLLHFIVDAYVVALAMGRVIGNVPFVSGHTLFLTYAILSSESRIVKLTALLVMAQTLYLKYFVWQDFVTSNSGIILGFTAALVVSKWGRSAAPNVSRG